jgi:hypothetical protein
MAETEKNEKKLETTPYVDWIIPQQDKLEQVIDARLAAHAENEESESKTSSRTRAKASEKPADGS